MKHHVGRLQVPVQDIQTCEVFDSFGDLSNYDSSFLLCDLLSLIKKTLQVEAVRIFLNHINVVSRFHALIVPDTVIARDHVVDLYLFQNHLHVIVRKQLVVVNLARVDLFGIVYTWLL